MNKSKCIFYASPTEAITVGYCKSVDVLLEKCNLVRTTIETGDKVFWVTYFDENGTSLDGAIKLTESHEVPQGTSYCTYSFSRNINVSIDVFKGPTFTVVYGSQKGYDDFVKSCRNMHDKHFVENEFVLSICSTEGKRRHYRPLTKGDITGDKINTPVVKFMKVRSCYSEVTEEMILNRAELMYEYKVGGKRPMNESLRFDDMKNDVLKGLNLHYFTSACIIYMNEKYSSVWKIAVDTVTAFFQDVHETMELSHQNDHKEMPRRMLTDHIIVAVTKLVNTVWHDVMSRKLRFTCESCLDNNTPDNTIGWGPRGYSVAGTVINVPGSDYKKTSDNESDNDDDSSVSSLLSTDETIKMDNRALAQCYAQAIDSANKDAHEGVKPFPVKTMCVLSTGQTAYVSSVCIEEVNAKPKIRYHGKTVMRVLPSNVKDDDVDPKYSNLFFKSKVDVKQVELMMATYLVCLLGVVDLEKHDPISLLDDESATTVKKLFERTW